MTQDAETGTAVDAQELARLLELAQAGDQSVLPRLRRFLDERPELWRQAGDLRWHAREALLGLAGGGGLRARECLARKMDELGAELGGPAPGPLGKLLVERLVLCWAQSYLADLDAVRQGRLAAALGAHAVRRQDAAQRRFLQALKALATVRELLCRPCRRCSWRRRRWPRPRPAGAPGVWPRQTGYRSSTNPPSHQGR
jgi:hypothetical protein